MISSVTEEGKRKDTEGETTEYHSVSYIKPVNLVDAFDEDYSFREPS